MVETQSMATANVAEPKQPTITEALEALDREVSRASMVFARVGTVADRLTGGVPRPVQDESKEDEAEMSVLSHIRARRERLGELLTDLEKEINRIERSL